MTRLLAILSLVSMLTGASPALAEAEAPPGAVDFPKVAAEIGQRVEAAIAGYEPAKGEEFAEMFGDIYFDVFEGSGMEAAIGARDDALKARIEQGFGALITDAGYEEPKVKLEAEWAKMRPLLAEAVAEHQASAGTLGTFLQALLIMLREGFEAILVVGALVAYLRRLGAADKVRVVWSGVAAALVASLGAAWAMTALIRLSGPQREAVEGLTMLFAAAVLTYVSHWLFAKREAARWQDYIKAQIAQAVSGGQALSLGLAAFLAVFREGAETVLFYQALAAGAPGEGAAIAGGFAVGCVGLVALYWLMRSASLRLPLGLFFGGTAVLLYGLAFVFVGQAVLELQGAGWLAATQVAWAPTVPALGIFPTVESLAGQGLLLGLLLPMAATWLRRRQSARATP